MQRCDVYLQLQADVQHCLQKLNEVTTRQLEAFRARDFEGFTHYDLVLEQTFGEKERAVGALRQHTREHKCQAAAIS